MELRQYIPVLMMIALAVLCVGGMFIGSMIMKKVGKRNKAKDTLMNAVLNQSSQQQAVII